MNRARVVAVSKDTVFVTLITTKQDYTKIIDFPIRKNNLDVVVGDFVTVDNDKKKFSVLPRDNLLIRSYGAKSKKLASNLDHLFIVCAVKPECNFNFVDRLICSAISTNVKFSILVNKSDLKLSSIASIINNYQDLGFNAIYTSTKNKEGCAQLLEYITNHKLTTVALCGNSGVGKSSLVNTIIPKANSVVGWLSNKDSLGRQTTTMAKFYFHPQLNFGLIDLPGIQKFGIRHVSKETLFKAFPEFLLDSERCRFSDCQHLTEPDCQVLMKLNQNLISKQRYRSFLNIQNEIQYHANLVRSIS